jgi:hypothetical protein
MAAAMAKNLSQTTGITTPGPGRLGSEGSKRDDEQKAEENTMAHRP